MSYLGDRAKALNSISPTKYIVTGDSVAANLARGDIEGAGAASKSHKGQKAKALAQQMQDKENEQYAHNQDSAKQLATNDQSYLGTMQGNVSKYQGDLDQLSTETQAAQKNSQNTYSNDIQPRMKDIMEQAHTNASSAMSLKDAMDPNNSVASGVRKLYSDQAKNEGRAGLASSATLQALGAQNFGTQLQGAGPMTGGQMAALMGQNQAASGAAYSNTQRRMQDLQDQGLAQGFNRSDIAYGQGRQAVGDYSNSVNNYQNSDARNQQQQAGYRGERGGYSGKTYGLQQQMADATRGVGNAGIQRDMSIYNTHMGGGQANLGAQIQGINAQQAQDAQMATAGLQTAGTVAGAYFGGPAGAAAGGQAGKMAGDANAPTPYSTPQTGNYASTDYSGGYQSPYSGQSAPANMVEPGAANPTYGGVSGAYGNAGGAYPGLSLADNGPGQKSRRSMAQAMRF